MLEIPGPRCSPATPARRAASRSTPTPTTRGATSWTTSPPRWRWTSRRCGRPWRRAGSSSTARSTCRPATTACASWCATRRPGAPESPRRASPSRRSRAARPASCRRSSRTPRRAGSWCARARGPTRPPGRPTTRSRWAASRSSPPRLPALGNGADARVAVVAYNFGASGRPAPLASIFGSWTSDGRETPAAARAREGLGRRARRRPEAPLRRSTRRVSPPGRYALKVVVTDTGDAATAESASPFEIK